MEKRLIRLNVETANLLRELVCRETVRRKKKVTYDDLLNELLGVNKVKEEKIQTLQEAIQKAYSKVKQEAGRDMVLGMVQYRYPHYVDQGFVTNWKYLCELRRLDPKYDRLLSLFNKTLGEIYEMEMENGR